MLATLPKRGLGQTAQVGTYFVPTTGEHCASGLVAKPVPGQPSEAVCASPTPLVRVWLRGSNAILDPSQVSQLNVGDIVGVYVYGPEIGLPVTSRVHGPLGANAPTGSATLQQDYSTVIPLTVNIPGHWSITYSVAGVPAAPWEFDVSGPQSIATSQPVIAPSPMPSITQPTATQAPSASLVPGGAASMQVAKYTVGAPFPSGAPTPTQFTVGEMYTLQFHGTPGAEIQSSFSGPFGASPNQIDVAHYSVDRPKIASGGFQSITGWITDQMVGHWDTSWTVGGVPVGSWSFDVLPAGSAVQTTPLVPKPPVFQTFVQPTSASPSTPTSQVTAVTTPTLGPQLFSYGPESLMPASQPMPPVQAPTSPVTAVTAPTAAEPESSMSGVWIAAIALGAIFFLMGGSD